MNHLATPGRGIDDQFIDAITSSQRIENLPQIVYSATPRAHGPSLFPGVVCLGTTLLLIHWEGRLESLRYIAYSIFAVLLPGLALLRKFLFARFRPSNWLVRMHHAELLIQFRSYLNYSLPAEDVTVVSIPYQNIRSARLVRERSKIPAQDGATEQTRRIVELELAGDSVPLSKSLAAEIATRAPRRRTWVLEVRRLCTGTIQ